jgi:hypothetical protein
MELNARIVRVLIEVLSQFRVLLTENTNYPRLVE